jgi:integrase
VQTTSSGSSRTFHDGIVCPAVLLEQRVAELRAWEWGDVDVTGSRIHWRGVKGRRGIRRVLWREVSPWLMNVILGTVPPDDRTAERQLFPGLNEGTMREAISRACRAGRIPHHSPHDLRHRRGSLWQRRTGVVPVWFVFAQAP